MQASLPQLFGRLPKAKFEVAAVPEYLEKTSASAYYEPGAPDGSRPGRIRIDTWKAPERNLDEVEAVAYHEGLPGHHMQVSIAHELEGVPTFRKFEGYTAYSEGWGLYAERLGKDIGLYQDTYSDYGRLEGDMVRAIRLVVDTGVHSQHWSRQQMVDFFHDHSGIAEPEVQAEVDRYVAWPGQATCLQDWPTQDSRAPRPRPKGPRLKSSTSALSTTRSSTAALCRSTSSATASTPGSEPRPAQTQGRLR
jgi:uncharacterized protein (DUF885 family)